MVEHATSPKVILGHMPRWQQRLCLGLEILLNSLTHSGSRLLCKLDQP